jgi:hypothetical protein
MQPVQKNPRLLRRHKKFDSLLVTCLKDISVIAPAKAAGVARRAHFARRHFTCAALGAVQVSNPIMNNLVCQLLDCFAAKPRRLAKTGPQE